MFSRNNTKIERNGKVVMHLKNLQQKLEVIGY